MSTKFLELDDSISNLSASEGVSVLQLGLPSNHLIHPAKDSILSANFDFKYKINGFDLQASHSLIRIIAPNQNMSGAALTEQGVRFFTENFNTKTIFISFTGSSHSGKSFLLDKILNLGGAISNHFSKGCEAGVYLWESSYVKDSFKIYLLQIVPDKNQSISMFAHCMTFISSVIVYIDSLQPFACPILTEIIESYKSFERFYSKRINLQDKDETNRRLKIDECKYFFIKRNSIESQNLSFQRPSFQKLSLCDAKAPLFMCTDEQLSMISFLSREAIREQYLKQAQQIFNRVTQIKSKCINNQCINGAFILKTLEMMELDSNIAREGGWDIELIVTKIEEDSEEAAYELCLLHYTQSINSSLQDESPLQIDQLLQILAFGANQAWNQFNQYRFSPLRSKQYAMRLQKYICQKEKVLVEINQKKNAKVLKSSLSTKKVGLEQWQQLKKLNYKHNSGNLPFFEQVLLNYTHQDFSDSRETLKSLRMEQQALIKDISLAILQKKNRFKSESIEGTELNSLIEDLQQLKAESHRQTVQIRQFQSRRTLQIAKMIKQKEDQLQQIINERTTIEKEIQNLLKSIKSSSKQQNELKNEPIQKKDSSNIPKKESTAAKPPPKIPKKQS